MANKDPQRGGASPLILRRGSEALCMLVEAYQYADDLHRTEWDFAVELDTLRQAGCTNSELRWLICKGFLQHAPETTMPGEESRSFRRSRRAPGLIFTRRTCFVLTEAGFQFAKSSLETWPCPSCDRLVEDAGAAERTQDQQQKPTWDRERQELRVADAVVKQFKVPAANQERVLAAFEEEGWPVRIDDPLPQTSEQDPKRRLHDTINSLNRNQKRQLIRFTGDGTGQGIRWELIVESEDESSRNGTP